MDESGQVRTKEGTVLLVEVEEKIDGWMKTLLIEFGCMRGSPAAGVEGRNTMRPFTGFDRDEISILKIWDNFVNTCEYVKIFWLNSVQKYSFSTSLRSSIFLQLQRFQLKMDPHSAKHLNNLRVYSCHFTSRVERISILLTSPKYVTQTAFVP